MLIVSRLRPWAMAEFCAGSCIHGRIPLQRLLRPIQELAFGILLRPVRISPGSRPAPGTWWRGFYMERADRWNQHRYCVMAASRRRGRGPLERGKGSRNWYEQEPGRSSSEAQRDEGEAGKEGCQSCSDPNALLFTGGCRSMCNVG